MLPPVANKSVDTALNIHLMLMFIIAIQMTH